MLIEICDIDTIYVIPKHLCIIELFCVDGTILTLSTGESVVFRTPEGAEQAWWIIEDCIRHNGSQMFYQESTSSFGIWD